MPTKKIIATMLLFCFLSPIVCAATTQTWTSTPDFDGGTNYNTTTSTNRYNQTVGSNELDFPYAEKDINLTAYWRFENNSNDETGSHNGVNTGASNITGYFGNCYDFENAENDYVTVTDHADFTFGDGVNDNPFSLSVWVKAESFSNVLNGIIGKDLPSPNREWALLVLNTGVIRIFLKSNGGNNQQSIDSTASLGIGFWHHIVTTYDGRGGANAADGLTIYINSSSEAPANVFKQAYTAMTNKVCDLEIGRYFNSAANDWDGLIDEVKVYDKELLTTEIDYLYNSGVQYKDEGNWTSSNSSAWSEVKPTSTVITGLDITLAGGDSNHNVSVSLLVNSTGVAFSNSTANYSTSQDLVAANFDNGFGGTRTDIAVRLYFNGNGSSTVSLEQLNISWGVSAPSANVLGDSMGEIVTWWIPLLIILALIGVAVMAIGLQFIDRDR